MDATVDDVLDIAEVARRTGVTPATLRYYERLDLVHPVGRNGLRRLYAPDVIDRLALIRSGQATGFTLGEIHDLLDVDGGEVRRRLRAKVEELDDRIATMQTARAQLAHALTCRHRTPLECPTFTAGMRAMLPHGGAPVDPDERAP